MEKLKISVVGIGATGSVLAAALLSKDTEIALVDPNPGLKGALKERGITISGAISYQSPVERFFSKVEGYKT